MDCYDHHMDQCISNSPSIAIIADDLTSAADGGAPFVRKGLSVEVRSGPQVDRGWHGFDVISVDCGSRTMIAKCAIKTVDQVTRSVVMVPILLKTIDSTLRGHIREELLAVYKASGRTRMVIAPAFPDAGRTTTSGIQYVNGTPVANSSYSADPVHPAWTSRIADLIPDGIQSTLILDAQSQADLNAQVAAIDMPENVLWVGSPGLAMALAETKSPVHSSRPVRCSSMHTLVVVGSANPVSKVQAKNASRLSFVTCVTGPNVRTGDPQAVLSGIADAAMGAIESTEITALIATGGDTMDVMLKRLNIQQFSLEGEFEPGFPIGRATLEDGRKLVLSMKAGGFGTPETLYRAASMLRKNAITQVKEDV